MCPSARLTTMRWRQRSHRRLTVGAGSSSKAQYGQWAVGAGGGGGGGAATTTRLRPAAAFGRCAHRRRTRGSLERLRHRFDGQWLNGCHRFDRDLRLDHRFDGHRLNGCQRFGRDLRLHRGCWCVHASLGRIRHCLGHRRDIVDRLAGQAPDVLAHVLARRRHHADRLDPLDRVQADAGVHDSPAVGARAPVGRSPRARPCALGGRAICVAHHHDGRTAPAELRRPCRAGGGDRGAGHIRVYNRGDLVTERRRLLARRLAEHGREASGRPRLHEVPLRLFALGSQETRHLGMEATGYS